MKIKPRKKDWLAGLLIFLVFTLLSNTESLRTLEFWGYGFVMQFSPEREADDNIVIINTARADGDITSEMLLQLTHYLAKAKPSATGFILPLKNINHQATIDALDTFISQHENTLGNQTLKYLHRLKSKLSTEQHLAWAFKRAGNIILSSRFIESDQGNQNKVLVLPVALEAQMMNKKRILAEKQTLSDQLSLIPPVYAQQLLYPAEALIKSARSIGLLPEENQSADHKRMPALLINYGNHWLPGFELALIRQHLQIKHNINPTTSIQIGDQTIATAPAFRVLPHYYISDNKTPPFKTISIQEVLNNNISPEIFKRKIILIGSTSSASAEMVYIPAYGTIPTIELNAHIISSVLKNDAYHLSALGFWSRYIGLLLVTLYLVTVLPRLRTSTGAALTTLLFILGCNIQWLPMAIQHTWIPCILPLLALLCGYILQTIVNTVYGRFANYQVQLSSANLQLAQNLQGQGQLDKAFEYYQKCLIKNDLLASLYNLGLDYERKRQFNKAIKVFNYIGQFQKHYKDIQDHIQQNTSHAKVIALGGNHRNTASGTLILSGNEIEKPMLGRYQIEKVIGSGAMGTVYLGKDPKISRTVAIKTLTHSSDDENQLQEYKKRFFREAETAGRLNHPNIVTIHDVGEEHDLAYIAMDYLPGHPLSEFTKQKSLLPAIEIIDIAIQVASALHYAHQNKVVHRDIKPANIIYDRKNKQSALTDFGVAHLADMNSTKTGTILGTPYYMSPEQLAGLKVDGRSDIFSLGITLYQLFTGELPFTGDNLSNLMYNITNKKQIDIKSKRPELPICIKTIINRCLQKKVEKRYQNGELLVKALSNCRKQL